MATDKAIQIAVNYSRQAVELLQHKKIDIDLFKIQPLLKEKDSLLRLRPVLIHFDFFAGQGSPDPDELGRALHLLNTSSTSYINTHLAPLKRDLRTHNKNLPEGTIYEKAITMVIPEIMTLIDYFGPHRVIVENVPWENRFDYEIDAIAASPELMKEVVETCQCFFLFDLAHARFAAKEFGIPVRNYIERHPLDRLAELHITGLGFDKEGRYRDHMPMTEEDWSLFEWALEQIANNKWSRPWVLALEYGGIGPIYEWRSESTILEKQISRIRKLTKDYGLC